MSSKRLENFRIAAIMTDGVEEIEYTSPKQALTNEGAVVHLLAPSGRKDKRSVQAMHHMNYTDKLEVDSDIEQAVSDDYDAVLLPGGILNGNKLRENESVKNFLRQMNDENKPIFSICHAGWILISAGIVRGRQMTSYHTIKDDMINAGAIWVNEPVAIDDNFISSRSPGDLPYFNEAIIEKLSTIDISAQHESLVDLLYSE